MRVAIVGGGIYGATVAIVLARNGHTVTLLERSPDILLGASGVNQCRLHRGYHYPRSLATALAARDAIASFRGEYGDAIIDGYRHYVAISKRDSLVTAEEYLAFLHTAGLDYTFERPSVVRKAAIEIAVRVDESSIDIAILRDLCRRKLRDSGVCVRLGATADRRMLRPFDVTIIATYSSLNQLTGELTGIRRRYQYELCEKPVVSLPPAFGNTSVVVLDGPFMCIDPLGLTGLFLLGNVVHAIHHRTVGYEGPGDSDLMALTNRGIVRRPPGTRIRQFVESAAEFFDDVEAAVHVGSMFTVRAVLPDVEETDARPTVVSAVSDDVLTVLGGKIGSAVTTANDLVRMLRERRATAGKCLPGRNRPDAPCPAAARPPAEH